MIGEGTAPSREMERGRRSSENLFRVVPGMLKKHSRNVRCAVDAWSLFISSNILELILHWTKPHVGNLTSDELKTFIALQYARGICGKNHSLRFLWNSGFGPSIFKDNMTRERFQKLQRWLRFDDSSKRTERRKTDPFTHIRQIFELFTLNCRSTYKPHFTLSVDEQLMSSKNRCSFITYMPNKPDKFGIKFWMVVDNETKYVYNILPYLGAYERESRAGRRLSDDVVFRLLEGLFNKGYNVTTDNFFTSSQLAHSLRMRGTTMVGTMRPNRCRSVQFLTSTMLQPYESSFHWDDEWKQLIVKYQSRKQTHVVLLSTMHRLFEIDDTPKRKPLVVKFYNQNKCGVDIVDGMLKMYTCRSTSRRWPIAVWGNMLDIAALNAWICYREATGDNISRKNFIMKLIEELCQVTIKQSNSISYISQIRDATSNLKCSTCGCRNTGNILCRRCRRNVCGTCCSTAVPRVRISLCNMCYV